MFFFKLYWATLIYCIQVTKHIFTSPLSALKAGVSNGTHACNAKLHGMKEVGAEHIAYAAVQASFFFRRFNLLSLYFTGSLCY
ncbi:hypothetical protein BDR05DRAFT_894609 [Suillus weaverae]|nr:hypothetical protein BDR05DRAFT_898178 [Suillus weaverae]KAG2337814.1 hypothetical protein BDR05DRAFT_894609 [Suillus weaverae]